VEMQLQELAVEVETEVMAALLVQLV